MDNFTNEDVITMKLLHYFITEKNYSPVIVHGAKDEIWLENMKADYEIIRIVTGYIHNNEQLGFDVFKTKKIVNNIKKKTFNLSMNVLSIFLSLGDNVNLNEEKIKSVKNIDMISIKEDKDLQKYDFLYRYFPDIDKKLKFDEKGISLFLKITDDINEKNMNEAKRVEKVFSPKVPYITYIIMTINIIAYLIGIMISPEGLFGTNKLSIILFGNLKAAILNGEYYRLITSSFIHANIYHIAFNMYALWILGKEAESYFGRGKFLIIYFLSALASSLLSTLLNTGYSVGASGAIFGLLGALLYFGYNYRAYLGNTLINQILPVIAINLFLGFTVNSVDNYGHIGGLIGGYLSSMAVGITTKDGKTNNVNGIILTIMLFVFLIFMTFFYGNM